MIPGVQNSIDWEANRARTHPADRVAAEDAARGFYRTVGLFVEMRSVLWADSFPEFFQMVRQVGQAQFPWFWLRRKLGDASEYAPLLGWFEHPFTGRKIEWEFPNPRLEKFRAIRPQLLRAGTPQWMLDDLIDQKLARLFKSDPDFKGFEDGDWNMDDEPESYPQSYFWHQLIPSVYRDSFGKVLLNRFDNTALMTCESVAAARILEQCAAFFPAFHCVVLCDFPERIEPLDGKPVGESLTFTGRFRSGEEFFVWRGCPLADRRELEALLDIGELSRDRLLDFPEAVQRQIHEVLGDRSLMLSYGISNLAEVLPNEDLHGLIESQSTEDLFEISKREGALERLGTDDFGTLFRRRMPEELEPLMFVEVLNSTPEPDGSFRNYVLRVPPDVSTPREAVAWTFGTIDPEDYQPVRET